MAAYSLADTNLFAYCGNNPVMYTDMTGNAPTWWQWTISGTLVAAGIVSMFIPVLAHFSGALLSAGINSILSGYLCEKSGGSSTAGWVGGLLAGGIAGGSATIATWAFEMAASSCGLAIGSYAVGGFCTAFFGGMLGSLLGGLLTASLDNVPYNVQDNFPALMISGSFTVFGGMTGVWSNVVLTSGSSPMYIGTALGITLGSEAFCDLAPLIPTSTHMMPQFKLNW